MKNLAFWLWGSLPGNARMFLDILRRCLRWKKEGVLFIHVPKAAGVSVSKAIYGRTLGHFYALKIKKLCPTMFSKLFTFAFVRHPVDRLYSAYQFSKNGGTRVMGMKNPNYYTHHPDFKTFDLFVTKWLIKQNLLEIDGVFRPQYLYVCDDKFNVLVDKVYKLENIKVAAFQISKKIDKKIIFQHYNKSIQEDKNISNETIDIIFKLYNKDFDIFSYNKEE